MSGPEKIVTIAPDGDRRVGVAALVVLLDVLERVHPGDLDVGEEGDDRDQVDRRAVARRILLAEADLEAVGRDGQPEIAVLREDFEEASDPKPIEKRVTRHPEGAGGEEVPGLVQDHQQGEGSGREDVLERAVHHSMGV